MMDAKSQTIETYKKSAHALAKKFDLIGARIRDIEKAFSYVPTKNPQVLEIGCGNGRDAKEIVTYTPHYLGIDISNELISLAQEKVPGGHFEVRDVESYQFPTSIDVIFSFASLLHSSKETVKDILDRAYASLRSGGIFFISLKYGDYHQETITDMFGTRAYYYYTPELITEMAQKYRSVYQDNQFTQGQNWFTLILQK
jgi:SAM-dependent methyltransferase